MKIKASILVLTVLMFTNCTVGILFTNITQPRSYRSATPADVQGREPAKPAHTAFSGSSPLATADTTLR